MKLQTMIPMHQMNQVKQNQMKLKKTLKMMTHTMKKMQTKIYPALIF